MPTFHFDQDDLSLFQAASHDRNPLHVSATYARKTSFGNPVVFGILGLLKAISESKADHPQNLESVAVQFRNPIFQGPEYALEIKQPKDHQIKAVISDAGKSLLTAKLVYRTGSTKSAGSTEPKYSRTDAATLKINDLKVGLKAAGSYAPDESSLRQLLKKLGLPEMGNGTSPIAALMLSSFIIGMELPGEGALFSQIKATFTESGYPTDQPLRYQAEIVSVDDRFGLMEISVAVHAGETLFAQMELSAYLRPESPSLDLQKLASVCVPSEQLRGKTALVIGGSRGLGAAISAALASQGCNVIVNYLASKTDAETLANSLPAEWGRITLKQGDASSAQWCRDISRDLEGGGGLDLLVCNAVPSIPNLPFSVETLERGQQFVDASVAMVATPLAALLPTLNKQNGTAIVMSTIAVADDYNDVPPEWYHYIMAKKAIEGLVRYLAIGPGSTRYLLVRPPRLLTDQTNTIAGRFAGLPVEVAASNIVQKLLSNADLTRYTLFSEFEAVAVE